jgi:signal transduction histidine kinase
MGGAPRRLVDGELRDWLLFAMVLFTGSQLHHTLWPNGHGSLVMTDADALRLAFVLVVAAGGVLELWRISSERAAMLAAEQERVRRMHELAALKADFSAIVAHELGSPTAAIRMLSELVSREGQDPEVRRHATTAIDGQVATLDALIKDVQTVATAERDEFRVTPQPLPVDDLLDDARTFAAALPGRHPTTVAATAECSVRADRERIGQVLRNLLSNAAKYSPDGAPIELRVRRVDGRVRVEVADHGRGIDPQDLTRIFEKFGRGRSAQRGTVAGAGLGLYLSRGIVRAHGSELEVSSEDGKGAVFSFDLEAER